MSNFVDTIFYRISWSNRFQATLLSNSWRLTLARNSFREANNPQTNPANIGFFRQIAHTFGNLAFLIFILSHYLSTSVYSQVLDDSQPNQPLFLQAEKLIGNATPNGFVRELIGSVVLTQGAVTITCNRAVHYVAQNRADLFGNVILKQGGVTMKTAQGSYDGISRQIIGSGGVVLIDSNSTLSAREGWYSTISKTARFYRNVSIENDSLTITCDTLQHERLTQNSYASGNAMAISKRSTAVLHGDSLVHFPAQKYSYMRGYAGNPPPMVSQIDTVEVSPKERSNDKENERSSGSAKGKKNSSSAQKKQSSSLLSDTTTVEVPEKRLDTLCITGKLLEAFRSDTSEVYLATGDVQMTRRQLAGRSDIGLYEKSLNRIWLKPSVNTPLGSSSANTRIEKASEPILTKTTVAETGASGSDTPQNAKDLQSLQSKQTSAFSVSGSRPRLWLDSTQLRSDSILILLEGKRLERINAYGKAFSATKNDTANPQRIDQLQGENIIISMRNDTLRSILAEGQTFSLYFNSTEEEDGSKAPDGAVRNAADTVKILFDQGDIETIVWRGKAEGEYIPEHIARKQLQTLRLKGFEWLSDRPVLERKGKQPNSKPKQTNASAKISRKNSSQKNSTKQSVPPAR